MRRMPSEEGAPSEMIPAMPHNVATSMSRECGQTAHVFHDCALEYRLVLLSAAIDEEAFHSRQIAIAYRSTQGGRALQCSHGCRERCHVVERHDMPAGRCREKVGLPATVVADDRQSERHRFQEHQTEAF